MTKHFYTEEERTELLCNPYTARVSSCTVVFTLAFKQFVMENVDRPGMTIRKLFTLAGYREDLFSRNCRNKIVKRIRTEAASPQGLREPVPIKRAISRTERTDAEYRKLRDRVTLLEQQITF